MKKSNLLLLVMIANYVILQVNDSVINNIVIPIQITILFVGYFVIRQLEENNENKKE